MTSDILSHDAKLFLSTLRNNFEPTIKQLLKERDNRKTQQLKYASPSFLKETQDIRDSEWSVLAPPKEIHLRSFLGLIG